MECRDESINQLLILIHSGEKVDNIKDILIRYFG